MSTADLTTRRQGLADLVARSYAVSLRVLALIEEAKCVVADVDQINEMALAMLGTSLAELEARPGWSLKLRAAERALVKEAHL